MDELERVILEAVPAGIVHVRADGAILLANEEARRLLGLSFDALTRKYTRDFETETIWEDGTPCAIEDYPVTRALSTGERQPPATIGVKRPDGQISWGVFTAVPVRSPHDGAVSGAVVTFLDITARRAAEEEQRELTKRLLVTERMASLGTLAAGVAHEINNPLTWVIANATHAAKLVSGGVTADVPRRLEQILDGAERIRRIVQDLRTFTRDGPSAAGPTDLHEALETAIRMADNTVRYRASIVRQFADVPAVHAEHARLVQVFLNLLVNAAHAMDEGAADRNQIRITTSADAAGRVSVEIEDTGRGIDEELVGRIFDPFVTTKDVGEGTGLGLYVSRNIVESIGGTISVESTVGSGSRFRVALVSRQGLARHRVPRAVPPPGPPIEGRPRVLVVDDEPLVAAVIARELHDCDVTTTTSGLEALELLGRERFGVVVCDLMMPDLSGMELYDRVKASDAEAASRFVFVTGGAFTERARRFVGEVDAPTFEKPLDMTELRALIAARVG